MNFCGCSASPAAGEHAGTGERRAVPGSATRWWCRPGARTPPSGPLRRRTGRSSACRGRPVCVPSAWQIYLDIFIGGTSLPPPKMPPRVIGHVRGDGVLVQGSSPPGVGDRLRIKNTTRVHAGRGRGPSWAPSTSTSSAYAEVERAGARTTSASCNCGTATPLAVDRYEADRITGSFVSIDELTFATIVAGMVGPPRLHLTEHTTERRSYYPACLDVSGRPCLVVGGGPAAARKVRGLSTAVPR